MKDVVIVIGAKMSMIVERNTVKEVEGERMISKKGCMWKHEKISN